MFTQNFVKAVAKTVVGTGVVIALNRLTQDIRPEIEKKYEEISHKDYREFLLKNMAITMGVVAAAVAAAALTDKFITEFYIVDSEITEMILNGQE